MLFKISTPNKYATCNQNPSDCCDLVPELIHFNTTEMLNMVSKMSPNAAVKLFSACDCPFSLYVCKYQI